MDVSLLIRLVLLGFVASSYAAQYPFYPYQQMGMMGNMYYPSAGFNDYYRPYMMPYRSSMYPMYSYSPYGSMGWPFYPKSPMKTSSTMKFMETQQQQLMRDNLDNLGDLSEISQDKPIEGAFVIPTKVNGAFGGPLAIVPTKQEGGSESSGNNLFSTQYLPIIGSPNWPYIEKGSVGLGRSSLEDSMMEPQFYDDEPYTMPYDPMYLANYMSMFYPGAVKK